MPKNPHLFETLCHSDGANEFSTNITLLDLFAGMALHSLLQMSASKTFRGRAEKKAKEAGMRVENYIARDAYRWGEDMLEERENILKGESHA